MFECVCSWVDILSINVTEKNPCFVCVEITLVDDGSIMVADVDRASDE